MQNTNPLQTVSRNVVLTTLIGLGALAASLITLVGYLSYYSHEQADITKGLVFLKDARFSSVQVQQFLTDASLTHDKGSLEEAKKKS